MGGAIASALKWVKGASGPLLYVSGQSGLGKSSLWNAAVVPALTELDWVVACVHMMTRWVQ